MVNIGREGKQESKGRGKRRVWKEERKREGRERESLVLPFLFSPLFSLLSSHFFFVFGLN